MADGESGNKQGKYTAKTPMNQSQPEVDGVNPCEQTSDVPEIQFEVPDDWCAPLGCETTVKMDEAACPSVRLRQLYIPLSHVPLIKKEVEDYAIDSHKQKKKGRRRSGRISTLSENDKHSPGRGTPTTVPATNRQVKRKDMKILLRGIKQEYTDAARSPQRLVREVNRPKNTSVPAAECKDQEAVESKPEKIYYCSFCTEVFDAPSELSVHARSHMKCKVCKKQFSYPRAFLTHQRLCAKADDERASTARRTRAGALHRAATEGSKYIVASRLRSGSHSWTVPLEVHEDQADLTSSGAETDLGVDRNEREAEHDRDAGLHPTLEAMGEVICSEQVDDNSEKWRSALEKKGMKVSRSKTVKSNT
ncbi:uncharacterized protein [Brachionichthys hirsutus]|uniref:uncharacterized protein isoform X2 n=1 Tax=Brachionichthys hirsutus TaxID=412623 RepID=UPI003604FEC3